MSTAQGSGAGGYEARHFSRRRTDRRRLEILRKKKQQPFQPEINGLEKRMMLSQFTVTNTNDSGTGSLRQAIVNSDSSALGPNTIDFDIPTTDPGYADGIWTITPVTSLPNITKPVDIDATTQSGYAGTPLIDIDGTHAGSGANGVVFASGSAGSTLRGLDVSNFAAAGVLVQDNNTLIQACYIGTDTAGTVALGNGGDGIDVYSSGNTIGGTSAAAGNLISGNSGPGIDIESASGNLVVGNFVGTNVGGTAALGNGSSGILIGSGASNNTIGGTAAADRNLVSGNEGDGVWVQNSPGNFIQGNRIGTDSGGTAGLGNTGDGVYISGAGSSATIRSNVIGGTGAGAGNVISGNNYGIYISSGFLELVAGNLIGTDVTGTLAIPNQSFGVDVLGGSGNIIGEAGAGNVISGNLQSAVSLFGTSGDVVAGNKLGTDVTGTIGLSNMFYGVTTYDSTDNTIGGTSAAPAT